MREGSLDAPTRHPLEWEAEDFYDAAKIDAELRRVFDICHGCRRCFNLCDSFPRLFDLIDNSKTGELDSVSSADFKPVVDACTLCDMCFMTKCPYVPPHQFNLDFPHLMLRYRAAQFRDGKIPFAERELTKTDRNGRLAGLAAPLANWASDEKNKLTRPLMEKIAGIDRHARLPKFHGRTLMARARGAAPEINRAAPGFGRKAVLYATCFANYNNPEIGMAALAVLARNGVETEMVYPGCCGMPKLEHGNLPDVARRADSISAELVTWIERGYDVIAPVASCALMLKFEWPLIRPDNAEVKRVSEATYDIAEYVMDIAAKEGLAPGLKPLDGGVTLHMACHARAQNVGQKAAELLRLLPQTEISVIERCSGHGGSWGVMKGNHAVARKIGRPVVRAAAEAGHKYICSECPLAADHIHHGIETYSGDKPDLAAASHPIELIARAYGL